MPAKRRILVLALAGAAMTATAQTAPGPEFEDVPPEVPAPPPHMPADVRSSIGRIIVIAGRRPAGQNVSGSYEKETRGLVGGAAAGSRIGRIQKQIGPVPVNFPIPVLTMPGAILGGLSGAVQREIQEFRDALTEELASADNNAITDDGLALDVFWALQKLPGLESGLFAPTTPVPEDTDAVLYVHFNDIGIDVQKKEAILTTVAEATVMRLSDGAYLYRTAIRYQDRDTLRNWTENDNALWRDYANFARHYLGREIAADLFDRVILSHDLQPLETESVSADKKNDHHFNSGSSTPTLAWELTLAGGDPEYAWADAITEADVDYDIEIYDRHQLVYFEEQLPEPRHTVAMPLEPCTAYRWSVRPSYRVDGQVRFGEWMHFKARSESETESGSVAKEPRVKGVVGRQASAVPAFSQDYPVLETPCPRR
ncbi:MAG: hypothetical protein WD672_08330 [Woeseia sp.]